MSIDFQPPTDSEYFKESVNLQLLRPLIERYIICLIIDDKWRGTAVLVIYCGKNMLLTAHHVAVKLMSARSVEFILKFGDNSSNPKFSPKLLKVIYWDPNFETSLLKDTGFIFTDKVKDLAALELDDSIMRTLNSCKYFYDVSSENNLVIMDSDALITMGIIKYGKDQINPGPFGMVKSKFSYSSDNGVEYIVCPVKNDTYEISTLGMVKMQSLGGLSGGGLWKIIKQGDNGMDVKLVGIGIAQRLEDGAGEFIFHGPKSINSFLNNCL